MTNIQNFPNRNERCAALYERCMADFTPALKRMVDRNGSAVVLSILANGLGDAIDQLQKSGQREFARELLDMIHQRAQLQPWWRRIWH